MNIFRTIILTIIPIAAGSLAFLKFGLNPFIFMILCLIIEAISVRCGSSMKDE